MSEEESTPEQNLDQDKLESEIVIVKLDIKEGDRFPSFAALQDKLEKTSRANFVRFAKRDSRTLIAAKLKTKRHFKPELEFYHLRYGCFYSQKNRPRGRGKRKRKSLAMMYEGTCPASITIKVSNDGDYLEVCQVDYTHNHPVNEAEFQRLLPKSRPLSSQLADSDEELPEGEASNEDLCKTVLKKCRYIVRVASNSNTKRLCEIIKNLDDYIYYLKYTAGFEGSGGGQFGNNNEDNKEVEEPQDSSDEKIHIIVESDNATETMLP